MYYQTITAKNPRHIYKEEDAEPYVSLLSFGSSRHTNVDTHYDNARSRRGVTRRRNVKPSMLSMLRHHASCQTTYVPPYRSHIDTVAHLDVRVPDITAASLRSVVGSSHPKACLELSTDEWHGRHRFSVPKLLALAEMTGCTAQQVKVFTRLDALFNADSALASWCDKRCVCSIVVPESAADGFTCVRLHLTWNRLELFRRFMAFEGAVMTQVLMRFGRRITAEMISDMLQDGVFRTVQAATPWTSDHLLHACRSTHLQVVPMVKAVLEHDDRDDCYEDVIQCMNVDVAAGLPSLPSVRVVHAVMTAMMHVDIKPYQLATTAWALDREKHDASCLDAFSFAVYDSTTHAYVGRVFFGARIGRAASSVLTFRCVEAGHAACTGVGDTDTDTDIDTDDAAQLLQTRIRGGFIVEDMGMGKTVEVLALILASKQQAVANANANAAVIHIDDAADEVMTETDDTANEAIIHTDDTADEAEVVIHTTDDMADAAEVIRTLRNCGTTGMHIRYSGRWQWHYNCESEQQQRTLVVVPLTLAEQWMNEIDTRVRDARVALPSILYHGPSRHRTSAAKLHRYDVVVTTYETLTCDVSAMRGALAETDTTWQCPHVLYFVPDEETSTSTTTSRPFQCYDVLQTQMENARFMMYIDADTAVCLPDWEGSGHGSHFGSIGDRVAVPRHATRLGRGFQCTAEHVATCHVCPVCGHDATLALSAFFTSHPRTPLEAIPWTRVVFDESHRIATTNTRLFAALSALQTECRWFLTGTPAPKDLPSLRAQLQLLGVGPVGRCITTPMALAYARTSESIGVHALTQQTALNGVMLRWLADLMVRHTKSDFVADVAVDTNTTVLHEDTVFVTLADADMREYRVARDATRARFAAIRDREQPWDVTEVLSLIAHERELCTLTTRRKTTQRAETRRRLVAERTDARRGARRAGDVQDAHLQLPDIPAGAHRADEECPICMELMAHAVVLPCMHCFCHECLAIVLSTVPAKCSLCQARLSTPAVLQLRLACEAVRRATIIPTTGTTDEDEATTATAAGATAVTVDDADVAVHYAMVKYDALLTYVQRQARQTLVFTHFEDVVQMLLPALRHDGVPACAVTGSMTRQARARAIADFNAGRSRVLVLSLRTAGVGLNLTTAQHVVFMEPCLNRALERQAVGRVHRIGLVHDVTVTHIVARGTIEERVRRYENVQQEFDTDVATEELRTVVVRDEARRTSWRRAQLQALIGAPT